MQLRTDNELLIFNAYLNRNTIHVSILSLHQVAVDREPLPRHIIKGSVIILKKIYPRIQKWIITWVVSTKSPPKIPSESSAPLHTRVRAPGNLFTFPSAGTV